MIFRLLLASLLLLPLLAWSAEPKTVSKPIMGVWKVVRIDVEDDPAGVPYSGGLESNPDPLPSQFIFTRSHYSIVWMGGKQAMRSFAKRWHPTDEEKLQRFAEVGMNTGTYTVDESRITVYPVVARVPEYMGGHMSYEYSWSGENLVLTFNDEFTFDEVPAPWMESNVRIRLTLAPVQD